MGTFLNPGNIAFTRILNGTYVDKTGMIGLINRKIGTTKNLICVSRPRRFGKSYAAQMLCAYYDLSCDSHSLFDTYNVAGDETYEQHLNQYHVLSLDISGFISEAKKIHMPLRDLPAMIDSEILSEIKGLYPDLQGINKLNECLLALVRDSGRKIVFIIDEWDAMIRETGDDISAQEAYLNMLRGWFKNNNFTPEAVAAAYMTGILPIKKDGSQSAISDFQEYSMLEPQGFSDYVGFNEDEVRGLCKAAGRSFEAMRYWYDGYSVGNRNSVYNPYSVMQALDSDRYKSYWKKTSAAETLMTYIDMDQEGLQDVIVRLIAGEEVEVDTDSFGNDVDTFTCKDDVLTLLIHLGYLTYEEVEDSYDSSFDEVSQLTGLARIPNEEVRSEFRKILRKAKHKDLIALVRRSDQLLSDTIACQEEAVAEAVERIHDSEFAPTFYNNEQSLRYVIKMAYLTCVDQYAKIEELPSGHGIADVVFLPKRRSPLPALIIELKWNDSEESAISQIKENNYPRILEQYGGQIILVGISYDSHTKKHRCKIEKLDK